MKLSPKACTDVSAIGISMAIGVAMGVALNSLPIGLALAPSFFLIFSSQSGEKPAKGKGKDGLASDPDFLD